MKTNLIFLFVCVSIMSLYQLKTNAQSLDCLDQFIEDPNNSCTFVEEKTQFISLASLYPVLHDTCGATFKIRIYECTDTQSECLPPLNKFKIFKIVGFQPNDCEYIYEMLFPGYPNEFSAFDSEVVEDIMRHGEFKFGQIMAKEEYDNMTPAEKSLVQCNGTPPQCEPPSPSQCNMISIYATQPSCYKFCLSFKNTASTFPWPYDMYFSIKRCKEIAFNCCITKRYYCMCDGVEQVTRITESITTIPGECLQNDTECFEGLPSPNEFYFESDCYQYCP